MACVLNVFGKVLLERDEAIGGPVINVQQLDFADGRTDGSNVQAVLGLHLFDFFQFGWREHHHILDAFAHVDEADRIVFESQGSKGRELLYRQFVVGRLITKATQNTLGRSLMFIHSLDHKKPSRWS